MRDHEPVVLTSFRGTFDRGEDDVCPFGFFMHSLNLAFLKGGVTIRDGFDPDNLNVGIPADVQVQRMELYERTGEAQRLLILDNIGRIWDSVTGSVILTIPTMTDFSCTVMFDRAYISPHNGLTGLPGEKLYVYEGSGIARPAAGSGPTPSTPMVAANSSLSGKVEAGLHTFAVAFESGSGFISKIGGYVTLNCTGAKKVDLSAIPLGPAGTTARILFSTKMLDAAAADPESNTYYFIPEGRIPNNLDTSKTVDFYDADLMEDASFLLEQLGEIPAGVGVGQYKSSLISWGENANPALVRISRAGEPESHNEADGYLTVYPGIGGGVKNCAEYRNQLIICKSHRTYSTMDNDDVPATWDVGEVDGSIGTECHGIGQILNIGSNVEDRLFVADRAGLRLFVGTYPDDAVLSFNVDDIWGRITPLAFKNVEISVDAINSFIYVAVPLDGSTTPNFILYGDYSEGMAEDQIRWTLWQFPKRPTSIVCSLVNDVPVIKFGSNQGYVHKEVPETTLDMGQRIEWIIKFPLMPVGDLDEAVYHFTGIRLRARGEGTLAIDCEGQDGISTLHAQALTLVERPGRPLFRGFNFTSEHCSVTLFLSNAGDWIILTKFILYPSVVWEGRAALQ
jgi:hypothetical protein